MPYLSLVSRVLRSAAGCARAFGRTVVAALALAAAGRARAEALHVGVEAGAGLAHELAGVDLTFRLGHVGIFIPFGPLGIENVFIDGAPTVAGGIRFFSGDGEGLVLTLQGAAVWTPKRASAEDAGWRTALALCGGYRVRMGGLFAQAAAGPIVNDAHGLGFGSLEHRRNWYRSWPIDLDVAVGFEF